MIILIIIIFRVIIIITNIIVVCPKVWQEECNWKEYPALSMVQVSSSPILPICYHHGPGIIALIFYLMPHPGHLVITHCHGHYFNLNPSPGVSSSWGRADDGQRRCCSRSCGHQVLHPGPLDPQRSFGIPSTPKMDWGAGV